MPGQFPPNIAFVAQCTTDVCRFYDPTEGDIQIGDYEIRDVTMSSLRSKFGAVPQVGTFIVTQTAYVQYSLTCYMSLCTKSSFMPIHMLNTCKLNLTLITQHIPSLPRPGTSCCSVHLQLMCSVSVQREIRVSW